MKLELYKTNGNIKKTSMNNTLKQRLKNKKKDVE